MTNTQIQAFIVMYEAESAAKASEKLYISQPALSRIIRSIEDELGYQLFIREKGKSLVPTPEGDRFYTIARNMRKLYEEARTPSTVIPRRIFRVSAVTSLFYSFFPAACTKFHERHPDVDLIIDDLHSSDSFRQLQLNQLDFAVVSTNFISNEMVNVPIMRDRVVLLCSHGLYPPGAISPDQLDKSKAIITEWSPEFQSYFEYWFGKNFESTNLRFKTGCHIEHFAELGEFWALVPCSSAEHISKSNGFDIHELTDAPPMRVLHCIFHRSDDNDLKEDMINCIRACIETSDGIELL